MPVIPGHDPFPILMSGPHEDPELKADLGLPPDATVYHIHLDKPLSPEWRGYEMDLLSTPSPKRPGWQQLLLQRVFCPDTPVFVEARWTLTDEMTLTLRGL
ncbi:MAG TPA: hypothetical protein VEQ11_00915, partial [Chloroflexota bacterium]|nr:hypothetical protein [Chloroflexota bacterium]